MFSTFLLAIVVGGLMGVIVGVIGKRRQIHRQATGTIIVTREDDKVLYSLELDGDTDEILASKDEVLFRVKR